MFIDVHCHVYGEKLEDLIENVRKNKVGIIINSGANVRANRKTLKIADRSPEFKATMGLYPTDAVELSDEKVDKEIGFIRKNSDKIVAVSEVGMDLKELDSLERQQKIFEKFIDLALEIDRPLIVHSRKAEKECINVLKSKNASKVVMHCFSGNMKLVDEIVSLGWFLSIPACVKHAEHFQKVVERVPIENLLCETDSPYLHPDKEFPNEPANVIESYKKISEIKGLSLKETEKVIESNFKRLFSLKI